MREYNCLDGMIANGESMLKTAYDKGYNQGTKDANTANTVKILDASYNKGMKDMFDAAYKILFTSDTGCLPVDDMREIFGTTSYTSIFNTHRDNPLLLIENIEEYEERKKHEEEKTDVYCGFINIICPYKLPCENCNVQKVYTEATAKAKEIKNG